MAAQDVFVTELGRSRKVTVIETAQLGAQIKEKHATPPSELNAAAISTFGKAVGLDLVLFTSVTEYGSTDMIGGGGGAYQRRKPRTGGAAGVKIAASLINVSTGEITWSDEASMSAGGAGSKRDMIRTLQQAVHKMVASMKLPGN
jgi:hypothetical protein